jgi:hypothetical protein
MMYYSIVFHYMKGSCEVIGNEQKYIEGLNHELTLLNTYCEIRCFLFCTWLKF